MASRATLESSFYYLRPAQRFPHQLTPCCPPFGYLFIHFTNPIITPSRTAELLISHYQTLSHSPERGDLFLLPGGGAQVSCPISWALATLGCLLRFFPICTFIPIILHVRTCSGCQWGQISLPSQSRYASPFAYGTVLHSGEVRPNICPWPCTLRYFPTLTRLFPPHVLLNTPAAQARQTLLKDRAEMVGSSGPRSFAATGSPVRF